MIVTLLELLEGGAWRNLDGSSLGDIEDVDTEVNRYLLTNEGSITHKVRQTVDLKTTR